MALSLTCPRGHTWNSEESDQTTLSVCPICGLAPLPPTTDLARTLDYPLVPPNPEALGTTDTLATVESMSKGPRDIKDRPTPLSSQHIPGYEILGELGRGGMGVVYKARQAKLNRLVALKMILAGANADPIQLDRFRAEAEAVARLHHPYIVQIYEISDFEGCPFFSLELVEGGTLADKLTGAPQPPRLTAHFVRLLALAMHSAHQKGIIHRDLKPGNILLAGPAEHISGSDTFHAELQAAFRLYGIPKITDFGLAKHLDVQSQTRTGAIVGTPSYMAPEQAEGRAHAIGPATDVYGLGAIFYEMLTGRPPFESDSTLTTIRQLLAEDPLSPSQRHLKLPRDLETICMKCLEKDPGRRYPSAEELAVDLERFLSNRPIEARPLGWWGRSTKWIRRHPTKATVGGVLLLALVTLLVMGASYHLRLQTAFKAAKVNELESKRNLIRLHIAQGTSAMNEGDGFTALLWFTEALRLDSGLLEPEERHRQRIAALQQALPRPLQLWIHDGSVNDIRFSSDGRRVLTAGEDGKTYLWDSETGNPAAAPLNSIGPVELAVFSPKGRHVASGARDGTVRIWDAENGQPLTPPWLPGGEVRWIDFSPDGRQLVTASGKAARVWEVATGKQLPGELQHSGEIRTALFSPDGRWLATAGDDGLVRLWNAADRKPASVVLSHGRSVLCLAFSPDSKRIASGSSDHTGQVWDVADGVAVGRRLRHRGRVIHVAFSPYGHRLLTSSEDNTAQIWRIHDGEPLIQPIRHKSVIRWAAFSSDGCRVATAGDDNSARVWSANSGAPLTPPLRANGSVSHVEFSPDGRWLATASDDGTARLWDVACRHQATVVDAAAVFHRRVDINLGVASSTGPSSDSATSRISPDGRLRIVINKNDNTARICAAQSSQPLTPPLAHRGDIVYAAFSDDGSRVVTASMDQTARVWETTSGAPLGPPLRHASAIWFADFNSDGRRLVTASDDNTARVWDIASGQLVVPPLKHDGSVMQAVFDPGGNRVATGSLDQTARVWDADTGQALSPPFQHPWSVRKVRFDAQGEHLLTTSAAGTQWSWALPTTETPPEDLVRFAQLMSGSRIDEHRGVMPLKLSEFQEMWNALRQTQSDPLHFSAEHVLHWHEQTAEECVRGQQWRAALGHFNQLVQRDPDNWLYRARRGRARAELGQWKKASDDFAEVVRRTPQEFDVWVLLAVLRLQEGDHAGYRRACTALLEGQRKANDPRLAYLTAWTCVLAADSGVKGEELVQLAKQAAANVPGDPDYLCTLGAALFRAGDCKSAARQLEEAQAIHGLRPCIREWLWLALVHQRMKEEKAARQWLMKATAALGAPDAEALPWVQRVQLDLLRREVEQTPTSRKR